jgi:aspartate/methionine/tyrosine aminotransferase
VGKAGAIVLAERLTNLGTETAFAVSLAAADWASQGNRVFPFHLGDINMPTPANMVEAMNRAIVDGKTGYCPAAGIPPLREALAADVGSRRGLSYSPANVVVQPGGKPVIGKFVQTVMNPGEGVLYPNPGYPIYESMIEYYGGRSLPYRYVQTDTGFSIDLEHLRSMITAVGEGRTKAIIYNNLQNPLGCESSAEEMQAIADIAIEHDLIVLADEAYFEMRYSGESRSIASLPGMYDRTVLLYTFSKKFAMTGWRLGAAIAPLAIADSIAKLNTNDESCTTHFVQAAGVEGVVGAQDGARAILAELERRRDAAWGELSKIDGLVCPRPDSTFYLFPKVTGVMARMGFDEVGAFATAALHATGVSFCTRKHFGRPQPDEHDHFVRFAYSGLSIDDIQEGLAGLRNWIEAS